MDEDLEFVDVQMALRYGLVNKGTESLDGKILMDCGKEVKSVLDLCEDHNASLDDDSMQEYGDSDAKRAKMSKIWPEGWRFED
nr:hypothetical protein [Tanacetum cinerariifolium]